MIIFIVSCCLIIICIVKWIFRDKVLYDFADSLPGPKAYPIFGSVHKLLTLRSLRQSEEERFKIVQEILTKYEKNDFTRFWLGPVLFVFINDPSLIKQVLSSPDCMEKSFTYKFLRLENGLLAAKPDLWNEHRKFLEDSFKQDVIKTFLSIFADSSNEMLTTIDLIENKDSVDVFKLVSRCALTMILATSFGIEVNEVHFSNEIIKAVEELIEIISVRCNEPVFYIEPLYRVTRTYFREKKYRKRCITYLDNVLKERRELIAPDNNNDASSSKTTLSYQKDEEMGINMNGYSERKNFIDHMILQGEKFTDEEIHDHIYTFVAAGYEKVALQTFYTLLLLAIHGEVQEKVYNEIIENLPHEKIEYASLRNLSYLDMVIKESMRLLPCVGLIGRRTQKEVEIGGRKIPKNIQLMINLFNLHRRKDIWGEDADQFNPDRFLPENEEKRPSNCFLPFSTGLRDCIGKEFSILAVHTIVIKLLKNYKLSSDLKTEELTYKAGITLKICKDVSMKIQKR